MKIPVVKKTLVRKWGNGYGILLPKSLVTALEWQGVEVEAVQKGTTVVIKKPLLKPSVTRAELLKSMDIKKRHELIDFGKPVGKEIW